jgi:hypothetical protein
MTIMTRRSVLCSPAGTVVASALALPYVVRTAVIFAKNPIVLS